MIKQQIKDVYFSFVRIVTLPNHYLHRLWPEKPLDPEGYYLHLGSGPKHISGMINIDGNIRQKKELWLDLRNGLPFSDQSAFFVYSCHVLEHFFPDDAQRILREIRRVLKPDGIARIAVPSMEHALDIAAGKACVEFPRPFDDPHAQAINYLFCDGQHKYGYSFGLLKDFALESGFSRVHNYSERDGVAPKQYGKVVVGGEPIGSLVVELAV
jgi:prepilin-type processing-associated H-X9-DG protein